MRLLLDTHIVLWWAAAARLLSDDIRVAIASADDVYISAASAWEAEIKRSQGKLSFPGAFSDVLEKNGFSALPVTMDDAAAMATLPMHHTDPFDRMLVVQAMSARLTLVTADSYLARYGVTILDARA